MPEEEPAQPVPEEETSPAPALDFDTLVRQLDQQLRDAPELRKKLASSDVISGIAGGMAEQLARRQLEALQAKAEEVARQEAEKELLRLAEEDPDAFAQRYLKEQAEQTAEKHREDGRRVTAEQVGRALRDLPEWRELREADFRRIAEALAGVPDDEAVPIFQRLVVDIVADKRAETRLPGKLQAEREAWLAEQAAARANSNPAPDLHRPVSAGTGAPDWFADEKAWNDWYDANVLRRPRRIPV